MSKRTSNRLLAAALSCSTIWAASCGGPDDSGGDRDLGSPSGGGSGDGDGDGDGDSGGGSSSGGRGGNEGGEGGLVTVPAELDLVSQVPESGATNVSARAPIVLEFSTEVDPSSAAGAIRIRAGGEDVPFSVSVDGRFVEMVLDEVPALPATVSVVVTSALLSTEGVEFDGDSWSFELPLWQRPEMIAGSAELGLAYAPGPGDAPFVLTGSGAASLLHYQGSEWGEFSLPAGDGAVSKILGVVAGGGEVLAAIKRRSGGQDTIEVLSFDGQEFSPVGGGPVTTASSLQAELVVDEEGSPIVVSLNGSGQIEARGLESGTWSVLGGSVSVDGIQSFRAAHSGTRLLIAAVDGQSDVVVYEWGAQAWTQLGNTIDRTRENDNPSISLAARGAQTYVAYQDGDTFSQHVLVRHFDESWTSAGSALDLELNNEVSSVSISVDSSGKPLVAWVESLDGRPAVVAARREGAEWRVLGELALQQLGTNVTALTTVVDSADDLHLAVAGTQGVRVARFNGSPSLPAPKVGMGDRGTCLFPLDGDPNFPSTLRETGCYQNLSTQEVVEAAIPYNINSILWTDNAYKRRYLLVPEGETLDFSLETELGVPVGTIVIKEFYTESVVSDPSSRIPVETRFLIKRCEEGDSNCAAETPWQGYTYQWNSSGSDGSLLSNEAIYNVDWDVSGGDGTYTHQYPSRAQCLECHNAGGRLLGVTGAQLNRPGLFGDVIENQIRALVEAGLFGETAPSGPAEDLGRLPSPPDVSRSLEERTRSYFQSNCSHCHRVGGLATAPVIPYFSYYGPELAAGNMCVNNRIVPGDHSASGIWQRDSVRDATQMPPLATLVIDSQQLPVTEAWIDSLDPATTCP